MIEKPIFITSKRYFKLYIVQFRNQLLSSNFEINYCRNQLLSSNLEINCQSISSIPDQVTDILLYTPQIPLLRHCWFLVKKISPVCHKLKPIVVSRSRLSPDQILPSFAPEKQHQRERHSSNP